MKMILDSKVWGVWRRIDAPDIPEKLFEVWLKLPVGSDCTNLEILIMNIIL